MKIQNLFNTGKMNKDVDERLVPNGEYTNALNVRVLNTAGSDAGALENERGNVRLTELGLSNNPECIGSVSDEAEEKIYWFVVNDLGYSYIFEYDVENDITSTVLADERASGSQVLNFSKDYKITGVNVVYNTSKKTKLLLFTDGLNQPRMVDIERGKTYGINNFFEDDICLYKKAPQTAPTVTPFNTGTPTENAVKENFFAFAYRYRYLDGGYSASSSFTYFKFSPKQFAINWTSMENDGMENVFNGYRISYSSGDHRVTDVQLLFKYPTDPTIYIVDNINKEESSVPDNSTQTYEFANKKIYKTLPQDEVFRIFDDIPLTAKAQDFINDRIVYGNTTSQYDLVEEEGGNQKIRIDYNVSLISTSQEGDNLDDTLSANDTKITFDFTDIDLTQGSTLTAVIVLESDEVGTEPNTYFNGDANLENAFILSQDYASVTDMVASQEFLDFLTSLSGSFGAVVTTTSPPDTVDVTYGQFSLDASTATSFTLLAPTITHQVDNTPADPNDIDFTDEVEQFKFTTASVMAIREDSSNVSCKSLRSYEVGLVYLDEYGRYSSILLPKESIGETSNEVFVSADKSVNINKLQVAVNHKAPYWADRYKFFVKVNKGHHYNVYATIFYEDGLYRWVLLQGANLGKVEAGQTLIVKSDDNGPLDQEVKTKVLEVTTKNAADEATGEKGWLDGNDILEKSGTYMKIRPLNFTMDFNEDNFITYHYRSKIKYIYSGYNAHWIPGIDLGFYSTGDSTKGLLQVYDNNTSTYIDQELGTGSQISIDLKYEESDAGGPNFFFNKKYTVNGSYTSGATGGVNNAFAQWLENETPFQSNPLSYSGDSDAIEFIIPSTNPSKHFRFIIFKNPSDSTGRTVMRVITNERTSNTEKSWLTTTIDLVLISGLLVFETEAIDVDDDVYYETEETFFINDSGYHQGNTQNQTASVPAICDLGFGNCFSFGNGVESIRIKDDRFKPIYDIKSRPNIAIIEGYERREDKNKLIYSGAFNENTGYNTLNEFNASRGITKYMDIKYGSIQKIFARESDLIVFQEDRVSKVLYGKNILTSPDGSGSLSQIEQVLGQDVPFTGEYGISVHPESFGHYEGSMYFTDANRGTVLRLGGDGLTPISSYGMKSFFKRELYGNKGSYNIGGFDPKYNQYVLTMGDEQRPQAPLVLNCASSFTRQLGAPFSYDLNVGSYPGTATISYTTSGAIDIVVVYNGNTYNNTGLTGTGSITFPVTQEDLDVTNIADVTISPATTANVSITHICPVPETMDIVLIVVNDAGEAGETIVNRYKHDGDNGNIYNSDLDIFEADELTRYETVTGIVGSDVIPANGDIVTVSSLKQLGNHTGTFGPCNSLGYLVSGATGMSVQDIVDQAAYPIITTTTTSTEEESTISFTFNRENTSQKLYIVYNYIDELPILVDDSVTGIEEGGSVVIDVVANDTFPSPYTITIGTPPSYGTAVVNANDTITYTHTSGQPLNDSFTYIVDRGGTCTAEATVTTEALAISVDTYIYLVFDSTGSMTGTYIPLQTMVGDSLKSVLQDLYATGLTESQGNTDPATNGSDEYDDKVTIVTDATERSMRMIMNSDFVNNGNYPSDASNVIVLSFQDEASPYAVGQGQSLPSSPNTLAVSDIASLKSSVQALNGSNSGFYRGVFMNVAGYQGFQDFMAAMETGTTPGYTQSTQNLASISGGSNHILHYKYNIEDGPGAAQGTTPAPFKPGSTTDRFDQWQYYYLYHITDSLNTLGFTPSGQTWPVILDD
jgi:hypothetical protein